MLTHKSIRRPIAVLAMAGLLFSGFSASGEEKVKVQIIPSAKYQPQPESGDSTKGKALFEKNKCAACHSIDNKGGCLAPPLDGIGSRRSKTFILARITNERSAIEQFERLYPQAELLVHPRLSAGDAKLISTYLLTLAEPGVGFQLTPHRVNQGRVSASQAESKSAVSIKTGKKVFYERGCIACHSIGGIGGQFAPSLDGISQRRDRKYVAERINAAQLVAQNQTDEYSARGAVMPPLNLSEKEILQVTDFLMTLPAKAKAK